MAAACALLGIPPPASAKAMAGKPSPTSTTADLSAEALAKADHWTTDTSFLYYDEADRITVLEPQIGVRKNYQDGRVLSVLATVDTISGATPLGTLPATPNTVPNTVTSPSGRGTNPTIGKVPTSNISDTRIALSTSYQRPVGAASTRTIGADVSKEHDYLSAGANLTLARDFNQKNTTLSFGLGPEFDLSTPNGGLPVAYATQLSPGEFNGKSDQKYLLSSLLGLTQVINREMLMQWNYSVTYERGYLDDPYKLLSLVNANGDPVSAIHEKRPDSRLQHSLYWLTKYNYREQDVFSLGLRYFADDWGIRSQTIDFSYRWQFHERRFFEPHVRYYHQSAADFFHVGLQNGQPLPTFASADYRLNEIDGITMGLGFGWTLRNGAQLIVRGEYYMQTGDSHPASAVGLQKAYDLFPTLNASIVQVLYSFDPGTLFSHKRSFSKP